MRESIAVVTHGTRLPPGATTAEFGAPLPRPILPAPLLLPARRRSPADIVDDAAWMVLDEFNPHDWLPSYPSTLAIATGKTPHAG